MTSGDSRSARNRTHEYTRSSPSPPPPVLSFSFSLRFVRSSCSLYRVARAPLFFSFLVSSRALPLADLDPSVETRWYRSESSRILDRFPVALSHGWASAREIEISTREGGGRRYVDTYRAFGPRDLPRGWKAEKVIESRTNYQLDKWA